MNSAPYFVLPGPEGFKGPLLDKFLAAGYYRMYHTMFTTHHTRMDATGEPLPVFWLRTLVNNIKESSTATTLRKKCARFRVDCKPAAITAETEALYSRYHSSIDFNTAATVYDCLHDQLLPDPFDSRMIEIRDDGILVAVGYFDVGHQAISGILNFYHPDYKKYSLGKWLILQKIRWAQASNIPLYYTGYISTAHAKFNYKLFPDTAAMELYLPVEAAWIPYDVLQLDWLQEYYYKHLIGQ
jgi:leucyl-tRNA---protein transferase